MTDSAKRPTSSDMKEIASTLDGRDITRGYMGPLLIPQDTVLRNLGGNLQVYEEVMRDDQVMSTFQQRRLAVTSVPWEVQPGGNALKDKKAAEFITAVLMKIGFDNLTEKMLFGTFYGYSISECMWAYDGSNITLDKIKVRKARRFRFAPNGDLHMLTFANMLPGEVMPPKKFWAFSCGADNDDEPYGLGLAHWLYWPVFFKKNGIKLWLKFLDKFAQPTGLGKYPAGSQQNDINKLLGALQAISTDSGIAVPEGMAIELLEAARSGTVDYSTLHDKMNQAISKVVLGQMMTSEAIGGHNKADVQMSVRQDLVKADADLICDSFTRTVATWLTEWNFPGAAIPKLRRIIEEPEDLKARSERDANLGTLGYRPTLKYVQEIYGGEYIDVGMPNPKSGTANTPVTPSPNNPAFAESNDVHPSDALAAQLAKEAAPHWDTVLEKLRGIVNHAESLESLKDDLLANFGDLPTKDLVKVMSAGFAVAELTGIAHIQAETAAVRDEPKPTSEFAEATQALLIQLANNQTAFAEALAAIGKGEKHFTIHIEQKQGRTTKTIKLDEATGNYIVTENPNE